jgi:simple sugar transport system permease protein
VALRGGFFSVGQLGQMLFGAAAASWLAGSVSLPPVIHSAVALIGAALLGGLWGWVPAFLKQIVAVNEIISTLLLNPIASIVVGLIWLPGVAVSARLSPLIPSTKLSIGLLIALAAALLVHIFLWRTTRGMEIRATASTARFALYGGIPLQTPVFLAMALSGALSGLAGGVEVLGVHYHFVSNFSAVNDFDGLIVAFAGGLHPAGVVLFAVLVGGLRTGSLVGLQIGSGIPRELGSALIALMLLFTATNRFFSINVRKPGSKEILPQ